MYGNGNIQQYAGDDHGNYAQECIFQKNQVYPDEVRHGRIGKSAEVYIIHYPGQVLAADR